MKDEDTEEGKSRKNRFYAPVNGVTAAAFANDDKSGDEEVDALLLMPVKKVMAAAEKRKQAGPSIAQNGEHNWRILDMVYIKGPYKDTPHSDDCLGVELCFWWRL
jgi:hypothetical protein